MGIKARMWRIVQKHLGYSDHEMEAFRENPRNNAVLAKGFELINKTLILEVVESHGCNSRHKVGEKFYLDGAGNLLAHRCPRKVCTYALHSATLMVFAANEMILAGVDPNKMHFKRANCFDVGLKCEGWGRMVLELSVK